MTQKKKDDRRTNTIDNNLLYRSSAEKRIQEKAIGNSGVKKEWSVMVGLSECLVVSISFDPTIRVVPYMPLSNFIIENNKDSKRHRG